jgi:hydroxymethylpyrimidine/phosphomethylpyrimidine kinase
VSSVPVALTIAGSDPSGGAGVQADLMTFAAFEVYGLSAIAALTAQSTAEVRSIFHVPASFLEAQLDALAADFRIDAMKTGMLGTAEVVDAVARFVDRIGAPVVVDPVLRSTTGAELLDAAGRRALIERLIPRAALVTPNLDEAEAITELRVRDRGAMARAAEAIRALGAASVVVKGGHLEGEVLADVLVTNEGTLELEGDRIDRRSTHGTGCTYASAVAAGLARGRSIREAVRDAHAFVRSAIAAGPDVGQGRGPLHPWFRWHRW